MHAASIARGLLAAVLAGTALPVPAYDGEDMAPGIALLDAFARDGRMSVGVGMRTFSGTWQRATPDQLRLLPLHWRGTRATLAAQRERLVRATLQDTRNASLYCELVDDPAAPSGACEETGGRVYYLLASRARP